MIEEGVEAELNKLQYMSNWVSLTSLQKKCTPKKPFIKLRKFGNEQFKRKHEMTINHLYLQKLYLICFALKYDMKLDISQNYYQEPNGLIFGVYELYPQGVQPKHIPNIKMEEEVTDSKDISELYDIINKSSTNFFNFVLDLGFSPEDQYNLWSQKISEILQKNKQITAEQFMEQYEKLTLSEHYVFNVKLKNALLMPTLLQNSQFIDKLGSLVQKQYFLLRQLFDNENSKEFQKNSKNQKQQEKKKDLSSIIKQFQSLIFEVWTILQKKCRVVQKNLDSAQIKPKSKEASCQLKIQLKFLIILSPSRSKAIINEQTVENTEQKDSKILTKIQIKPQNGSILPVSGNAINVTMVWQALLEEESYRLKLECFNNRKLEEMYFDELLQFWYKLQSDESFRDLLGVDKYTMIHNVNNKDKDVKGMETMFTNNVPRCTLLQSIKEVDKIVSLAIAMDQAIQICERKGSEHEDPKNFQLQQYMKNHVKERFKRALMEIQKNYQKLFKSQKISQY